MGNLIWKWNKIWLGIMPVENDVVELHKYWHNLNHENDLHIVCF